jgi:hypothetical protein
VQIVLAIATTGHSTHLREGSGEPTWAATAPLSQWQHLATAEPCLGPLGPGPGPVGTQGLGSKCARAPPWRFHKLAFIDSKPNFNTKIR